jgi:preprotein translocase SecE subunit
MATMSEVNEQGTAPKPSFAASVSKYFGELKFEWKKISFPSRKELQQSTTVVFVFTLLVMGFIMLVDIVVGWIFANLILPKV